MNINQYNEQAAATINIDDIASTTTSRNILRGIQGNNSYYKELWIRHEVDDEQVEEDYVPEGSHDMGWLGYFIGKSKHLRTLNIRDFDPGYESVSGIIVPFLEGVSKNKSIQELDIHDLDVVECRLFTILYPFLEYNNCLRTIIFDECVFGVEECRLFASALGNSTNKILEVMKLENNNIADEGLVDIITALSKQSHLGILSMNSNRLSTKGCKSLATLLHHTATQLLKLDLTSNEINDEGLEALVPILAHHNHLLSLKLCNNQSVSSKGWEQLETILRNTKSKLETLDISNNHIDDEVAAAYALSLTNNGALITLNLLENYDPNGISSPTVESAFSKLLCDTSSVNSTFLSNHIIDFIFSLRITDQSLEQLKQVNRMEDKKKVAMIKILLSHDDLDMLPFFEWEFQSIASYDRLVRESSGNYNAKWS